MADVASESVWIVSNAVAACMFAGLFLLLVVSSLGRVQGILLTIACGLNALWCASLALALYLGITGPALDVLEILRDGAWLVFVAGLLPAPHGKRSLRALRWLAVILPVSLLLFLCWQLLATVPLPLQQRGVIFSVGVTLMALWGLVLLEQLYRAADLERRWGVKYICLGVGALFAYDFLMYSYGLVYGRVDLAVWEARAAVNALAVPLIAVSMGRNPTWSPKLQFSQQAAFHTGAIFLCGGYLLLLSAAGYYIRNVGGTWSGVIGVLFQVVITLLLLVLLLSGQVRARAKVLIKKNFFRYKYDYRAEWLGLTQRLSHAGDIPDPYQRSIRAVAHIVEAPAGALWLARDGAYMCVSNWNMPIAAEVEESSNTALALFLRDRRWIIDLDEYARDPGHYNRLELPRWLDDIPRARLLMPLFFEEGLLGFMLLSEPRAHYALTWEDLDLLKTLGSQVGGFLGQQENNQALAQARQFEAVNRLTAFLMHDLKNIANQQSLVVQNAQKHKRNPEFVDDMIATIDSSVERIKRLLLQLQRTTASEDALRRIDVAASLEEIVASLRTTSPRPALEAGRIKAFIRVDPERFMMVLGHIIGNAQDATPGDGSVRVQLRTDALNVFISIRDTGAGMAPAFVRESLFKPFFTTKSTRGMGIGAYQAREFARAAGGDVEVESVPGEGTTFVFVLPAVSAPRNDSQRESVTELQS